MQKARIKLWGRDPKKLDEVAHEIKDLANKIGVPVRGPIPLPVKRLRITCIRTPCGDGMHRGGPRNWDHWEMRIHNRCCRESARFKAGHAYPHASRCEDRDRTHGLIFSRCFLADAGGFARF